MLRLRPYKPCDAKYIEKWITDKKMFYQWSADILGEYPLTAEKLNENYRLTENNDRFWQMTAFDEFKAPVGHFIMRFTDEELKSVRLGFIIVDNNIRGKGYGKEMLRLALKYAFEILKADEVSLGVFANNPQAFYCYQAAGFRELESNGRSEYTIEDEKWECIEMHIVKDEWIREVYVD